MTVEERLKAHAAACREAHAEGAPRPRWTGGSLNEAYLRAVDLSRAYLRSADLIGADLIGADLRNADFTDASLIGADLRGADFTDADLSGTCLDPTALCPALPDAATLATAGLSLRTVRGRMRVYGRRTAVSRHVGSTEYRPWHWYQAPWLSVDQTTECHPGIYLGGTEETGPFVEAWAYADEAVWVSPTKGLRARRIYVTGSLLKPEPGR